MDFLEFNFLDIVDILLVAFLLFQLYKLVRGTVAIKIFIGITAIYLLWKLVEALQMDLLSEILGQFIGVGVIAVTKTKLFFFGFNFFIYSKFIFAI